MTAPISPKSGSGNSRGVGLEGAQEWEAKGEWVWTHNNPSWRCESEEDAKEIVDAHNAALQTARESHDQVCEALVQERIAVEQQLRAAREQAGEDTKELLRTWLMHYAGRARTDDPLLLQQTRDILDRARTGTEKKES